MQNFSIKSFLSTLPETQRPTVPQGRLIKAFLEHHNLVNEFEEWKREQKRVSRARQPRTDEDRENDRIRQAATRALRQGLCTTREESMAFVQPRLREGSGSIPRRPRWYELVVEHKESLRSEVLKKLETTTFRPHHNHTRRAIAKGVSIIFGKVYSRRLKKYTDSTSCTNNPRLYELLKRLASEEVPNFPYTTVAVNKNVVTRPHVDKFNVGPTLILGLGSFKGGELVVQDKDFALSQNKWLYFWGKDMHFNRPLKRGSGDKYTITFFTLLPPYASPTQATHTLIGQTT